ncbi:hypothetical protein DPMN_082195 [Dreissena polymorpha]|uniref:Uncharacterized protein n=1 Tax=Dreissena polymorpha TaxID=45954 RepID=A0A9D3YA39_DREPO|nr:hypothetical protein DPMN_082195 [Dreissena polymorpha]
MVCVSCSVRTGPLPQSAAGVISQGTYGLCLMFSAHWPPTAVCRRSYITGYIWFVSHVQCALAPYRSLPQELESLKTVLEMKNKEINKLRTHDIELQKKVRLICQLQT